MIDILHTILTDVDARSTTSVESKLSDATSAGIPWFDVQ